MARAGTKTWLSLDRWAEIFGINPLHFNQLDSTTIFNVEACGEVWMQYAWQNADRISREDLARAIRQAELNISNYVGYNLLPDWIVDERVSYALNPKPEYLHLNNTNPRWQGNGVHAKRGFMISGGVKTKSAIQTGAAVTRSDPDGDGYSETCTVSVATSVTDENEVRVFYPGQSGKDAYEIRPITVSISGGTATITFKSWQIVALAEQERIGIDAVAIDADDDGMYETTVDVYRVYNDPQTQATFMWEQPYTSCSNSTCVACQYGTQSGCFHIRDPRLSFVVPEPATWDSDDEEFDSAYYSVCRQPDFVKLSYYSGWLDAQNELDRPYVELDPYWEIPIAYYAASLLHKPVCDCGNVMDKIKALQRDRTFSNEGVGAFINAPHQISNPLGSTVGAKVAYDACRQEGRVIGR